MTMYALELHDGCLFPGHNQSCAGIAAVIQVGMHRLQRDSSLPCATDNASMRLAVQQAVGPCMPQTVMGVKLRDVCACNRCSCADNSAHFPDCTMSCFSSYAAAAQRRQEQDTRAGLNDGRPQTTSQECRLELRLALGNSSTTSERALNARQVVSTTRAFVSKALVKPQSARDCLNNRTTPESTEAAEPRQPLPSTTAHQSSLAHRTKPIKIVDAHKDDVHGLLRIPNRNTFASASKDGYIYLWDHDGNKTHTCQKGCLDYRRWATALCTMGDCWASASRDGTVTTWSKDGVQLAQRTSTWAVSNSVMGCKARNSNRINCMFHTYNSPNKHSSSGGFLYIGAPAGFTVCDASTWNVLGTQQTNSQDWVYTLQELPTVPGKLLITTGGDLDIWTADVNQTPYRWRKARSLVQERKQTIFKLDGKMQRRLISAVTQLWSNDSCFGLAVFDGSIRVIDITTGQVVKCYQEHVGRTWAVENLRMNIFASCGDDGNIKLWDVRTATSVLTLPHRLGRVSQLLLLNDNCYVSAWCDDAAKHGGRLSFWDLRMMCR